MNGLNIDKLTDAAKAVEARIHEGGWDRPPTLWLIVGKKEDPEIVEALPGFPTPEGMHPCDMLYMVHAAGIRMRNTILGLALSTEAYRHLYYEEMAERSGSSFEEAMTLAAKAIFPELTEEELEAKKRETYYKVVQEHLSGPASQPDEARVEMRVVTLALWGDMSGTVTRERPTDKVDVGGFDGGAVQGRVLDAMHTFLRGDEPQPVTKDIKGILAEHYEDRGGR